MAPQTPSGRGRNLKSAVQGLRWECSAVESSGSRAYRLCSPKEATASSVWAESAAQWTLQGCLFGEGWQVKDFSIVCGCIFTQSTYREFIEVNMCTGIHTRLSKRAHGYCKVKFIKFPGELPPNSEGMQFTNVIKQNLNLKHTLAWEWYCFFHLKHSHWKVNPISAPMRAAQKCSIHQWGRMNSAQDKPVYASE